MIGRPSVTSSSILVPCTDPSDSAHSPSLLPSSRARPYTYLPLINIKLRVEPQTIVRHHCWGAHRKNQSSVWGGGGACRSDCEFTCPCESAMDPGSRSQYPRPREGLDPPWLLFFREDAHILGVGVTDVRTSGIVIATRAVTTTTTTCTTKTTAATEGAHHL